MCTADARSRVRPALYLMTGGHWVWCKPAFKVLVQQRASVSAAPLVAHWQRQPLS